jgi:NAD(P)H-hydrate epimerase
MSYIERITTVPEAPSRAPESNKGDFGRVLVISGSRGMSGAAILCASAALRSGAGLVTVAVPEGIQVQVAASNPCYMTAPMPQDGVGCFAREAEPMLLDLCSRCDVVAFGPGIGRGDALADLAVSLITQVDKPLVVDADGLNNVAGRLECLQQRWAPLIFTPHPGEFARLVGQETAQVQENRVELAINFASQHAVLMVLKGHGTIVTDGLKYYVNDTGNPGMATGGTGDVLTGIISALLGQGLEPFAAAQLGVFIHGRAGDLARDRLGEMSLIAADLLDYLGPAFRSHAMA